MNFQLNRLFFFGKTDGTKFHSLREFEQFLQAQVQNFHSLLLTSFTPTPPPADFFVKFILTKADFFTKASKSMSRFLGTSRAGKRSPIRPMKTGTSSVTILGMLKSRNARMSTWSSGRSLSLRFREPATTNTDLMARRPQS